MWYGDYFIGIVASEDTYIPTTPLQQKLNRIRLLIASYVGSQHTTIRVYNCKFTAQSAEADAVKRHQRKALCLLSVNNGNKLLLQQHRLLI